MGSLGIEDDHQPTHGDHIEKGQTVSQVQTAADSWKYYGLPKGSPGTLGLCQGGTGER
jgi:hypothetical protein